MLPELTEIKKRRKVLGLTQFQLAREAGVSQSLIAKLESGLLEPTYSKAKKIFFVLDKLENKSSKKAKDVMSNKILKIESRDFVKNAIKQMKKNDISQLPVFDSNLNVGSISEKTILDKIASGEDMKILESEKIEDVMDDPFPSINEDTPINSVAVLLQHSQALLVLKKNKLAGIITKSDLLKS